MRCDPRRHWKRKAVAVAYAIRDTPAVHGVHFTHPRPPTSRSTRTQPTPAGAARTVRRWVPRAFIVHVVPAASRAAAPPLRGAGGPFDPSHDEESGTSREPEG